MVKSGSAHPGGGHVFVPHLIAGYGSQKTQGMNQDCNASATVLPTRAGEGEILISAASMAAIFDSASPLPPAIIAPAWPIRRPGGAVRPAMKPTIGFFTFECLMNSAASSSAEPPIS